MAALIIIKMLILVLQNLFMNAASKWTLVCLPQVKSSTVKLLLQFIYTGEVEVQDEDEIQEVLKAAELLQVRGLLEDKNKQKNVIDKARKIEAVQPSNNAQAFDDDTGLESEVVDETPEILENFNCELEESNEEMLPLPPSIWNTDVDNPIEIPEGDYKQALEMLPQPICPVCKKSCSTSANLQRHYEAVHVNNSLTCNICFKDFSRQAHLNRHKRTVHSNIKPYSCPECGRPFNRQDKLKVHMDRAHSNLRQSTSTTNFMEPDLSGETF